MGSRGQAVRETLAHPTLTWGFWPEVIQAGHLVVELAVELAHGKFLYPTLFVSEVLYFRVLTWCGWVGTGNMALPSGIPCFGGWDPHFFGVHLLDPSNKKNNLELTFVNGFYIVFKFSNDLGILDSILASKLNVSCGRA